MLRGGHERERAAGWYEKALTLDAGDEEEIIKTFVDRLLGRESEAPTSTEPRAEGTCHADDATETAD